MAFLRNQLSRVWGRREESECAITHNNGKQFDSLSNDSRKDSGFFSLRTRSRDRNSSRGTLISIHDHSTEENEIKEPTSTPTSVSGDSTRKRSLHKAASTTFQLVSDSIRSKTHLFYVSSARSESPHGAGEDSTETPDRMSSILSTLRSRGSRYSGPDRSLEEPPMDPSASYDIPHELDVDIPNPSLLDPRPETFKDFHPMSPIGKGPNGSLNPGQQNIWPSPTHVALRRSSNDSGIQPVVQSTSSIESPYAELNDMCQQPSRADSSKRIAISGEEAGCTSDIESSDKNTASDGFSPAVLAPPSHTKILPVAETTARSRAGGSLFVKGNFKPTASMFTTSPYRKALQSQENLDAPTEPQTSLPNLPGEPLKSVEQSEASRRPSIHRTTSLKTGLSDLVTPTLSSLAAQSNSETKRLPSEVHEADVESESDCSETPSMGSRSAWERTRADREHRYQAVQAMNADTESDTDSRFGLELHKCPTEAIAKNATASKLVYFEHPTVKLDSHARKVQFKEINPTYVPGEREASDFDSPEVQPAINIGGESLFRPQGALKYAIEAIERPNGVVLEGQDEHASNPKQALQYAIEAINRKCGEVLDSGDDVATQAQGALEYAVEAIERPSGDVLNAAGRKPLDAGTPLHYAVEAVEQLGDISIDNMDTRLCQETPMVSEELQVEPYSKGSTLHYEAVRGPSNTSSIRNPNLFKRISAESELETCESEAHSSQNRPFLPLLKTTLVDENTHRPCSVELDDSQPDTLISKGFEYYRSTSSQSVSTTGSCAVTTHSPLCYAPSPFPNLHIRTSPVRRTSSINNALIQALNKMDGTPLSPSPRDISGPIPEYCLGVQLPGPKKIETENSSTLTTANARAVHREPEYPEIQLDRAVSEAVSSLHISRVEQLADICHSPRLQAVVVPEVSGVGAIDKKSQRRSSSACASEGDFDLESTKPEVRLTPGQHIKSEKEKLAAKSPTHLDSRCSSSVDADLGSLNESQQALQYHDHTDESSGFESDPFCTPLSTPVKRKQRIAEVVKEKSKRDIKNDAITEHDGLDRDFIAAMLPIFKTRTVSTRATQLAKIAQMALTLHDPPLGHNSDADELRRSDAWEVSNDLSGGKCGRVRSWQMRESSFGGGDFTYDAVGSPKKDLQTSSIKKGVWWVRNAKIVEQAESPLARKSEENVEDGADQSVTIASKNNWICEEVLQSPGARSESPSDEIVDRMRALWSAANQAAGQGRHRKPTLSESTEGRDNAQSVENFISQIRLDMKSQTNKGGLFADRADDPELREQLVSERLLELALKEEKYVDKLIDFLSITFSTEEGSENGGSDSETSHETQETINHDGSEVSGGGLSPQYFHNTDYRFSSGSFVSLA
ncbi:hypothetical protein MMC24_007507 [Lignoscripta atroalba]|nr:hypothetical protein [Lignoscripta atroalba]